MTTEQLMYKLFSICYKNNIEYDLKIYEDKPNYISFDQENNVLYINLSDEDDVNLKELLNEKIKELQQLFH